MPKTKQKEEFVVNSDELVKKVKKIIKEGNARRIIIKTEKGEKFLEIPLSVGVVGAMLAPVLAALGTLAALMTKCTIIVEKK